MFYMSTDKLELSFLTSMCDGTAHELETRCVLGKYKIKNAIQICIWKSGFT